MIGTIGKYLVMAVIKTFIWPKHIKPAIESLYKNKDAVKYARFIVRSVSTRGIASDEVKRMTAFGELKLRMEGMGGMISDSSVMLAIEAAIKAEKVGWK